DGIRDFHVTGVQTCALPISLSVNVNTIERRREMPHSSVGPISRFIDHQYRHFNSAALRDAAIGYRAHLDKGGKMLVTLAGAMSKIGRASCRERGTVHVVSGQ